MFKKSAAAYSICVDEMKWMRDVMSTKKLDLIYQLTFPASHLEVRQNFPAILLRCSRYFVTSKGDTTASSCEQSLLSCHAEVLPLLFVVMLSLIVASGRYLLALESHGAVSTTWRLYGNCKFWHLSTLFHLLVANQSPIVVTLSCSSCQCHKNCYISWWLLQYFGRPVVVIQS